MTGMDATDGQRVYTPLTLAIYDLFVLGFSNRFLWGCPSSELAALYQRNAKARHLDVGVGTGYFLDNVHWPVKEPLITLFDLNPHSLRAAAERIERYEPKLQMGNVLETISLEGKYNSIGLCYLLHCLPGGMSDKAVVFDHLMPLMEDDGVLFGATICQGAAPRSWAAQKLMNFYNRKGIFSNEMDDPEVLAAELDHRFRDVIIHRFGAVSLFEVRRPKLA